MNSNAISLKASETVRPDKRAVPDQDLTWSQIMVAKALMLDHMRLTGWPEEHRTAISALYYHLDNHPWRAIEHGEAALIRYHATERILWHRELSSILEGNNAQTIWDIADIRQTLLDRCMEEVKSEKAAELVTKVSPF